MEHFKNCLIFKGKIIKFDFFKERASSNSLAFLNHHSTYCDLKRCRMSSCNWVECVLIQLGTSENIIVGQVFPILILWPYTELLVPQHNLLFCVSACLFAYSSLNLELLPTWCPNCPSGVLWFSSRLTSSHFFPLKPFWHFSLADLATNIAFVLIHPCI